MEENINPYVSNSLALSALEKKLEMLMINTEENFIFIDTGLSIVSFNEQFRKHYERYFGKKVIRGSCILDYAQPERREIVRGIYEKVFKGETLESQIGLPGGEGPPTTIHNKFKPIYDENGSVVGAFVISRDISEITEAQNKLLSNEKHFRTLIENTTEIITLLNEDITFRYISPAIKAITGFAPEEINGREAYEFMHPEEIPVAKTNFDELIHTPGKLKEHTYRFLHKNGHYVWLEGHVINFLKDENIGAIVANFHDISERRKTEQQLQQLLTEVNDRNQRLQNFANIISHNIQSHSNNISGLINLAEQTEEPQKRSAVFNMLKTSSDKLHETIDNLNEIINIKGNHNAQFKTVCLKEEIDKTRDAINSLFSETNATLINDVPEHIRVSVIPSYLESVLLNLFTNAIKYRSPEKELIITATCSQQDDFLVLSVADNGSGIDLNKHGAKVFGMYKTFHNRKDSRGFGLFLSKSQMEHMKGTIEVESETGKGSTFKIFIKHEKN